jgi:hypothetical protein
MLGISSLQLTMQICLLWLALICSAGASNSSCYRPDGNIAADLVPCKLGADVSHCCRQTDVCLTQGLCFSPWLGAVIRRGCTDWSWKSSNCSNVCNDGKLSNSILPAFSTDQHVKRTSALSTPFSQTAAPMAPIAATNPALRANAARRPGHSNFSLAGSIRPSILLIAYHISKTGGIHSGH